MNPKEKVAVSYKGKHFIIQDRDTLDEMDFLDPYVDVQKVIENALEEHVCDCIYYGIPAYIGSDENLKGEISDIEYRISEKK